MSERCIANVSTGPHYPKGQVRLQEASAIACKSAGAAWRHWREIPKAWPTHEAKPYAFKAFALKECERQGFYSLLWCDASILPVRSLEPAFAKIERDGYLLMNNGYSNYEWTADSAYPALFGPSYEPDVITAIRRGFTITTTDAIETMRAINRSITHTVGAFFGCSLKHPLGRALLDEYYRLASETDAFCGPWQNLAHADAPGAVGYSNRCGWCGPVDVRGHRHDQTALSVIAWRLGLKLTDCPTFLIYGNPEDAKDERTLVVVNGAY